MSSNGRQDRYGDVIGQPQGDTSDTTSSTPVGTPPPAPAATERSTFYPLAGGTPAPTP